MAPPTKRETGSLARWNDDRGFGFIVAGASKDDVFVHISEFPEGAERPRIGDRISFERVTTPDGKVKAVSVNARRAPKRQQPKEPLRVVAYILVAAFVLFFIYIVIWWSLPAWVVTLYVGVSIVTYAAYAIDKRAALRDSRRVPESSLHALGIIGGWPGALVAQEILRHKTKKASFRAVFWVTVGANIVAFSALATPLVHWLRELTEAWLQGL